MLVADALLPRLHRYSAAGRLLASVGRFGDGRGEYRRVRGVTELGGAVVVLDSRLSRATRLRWDLSTDTTFRTPVAPLGTIVPQPNGGFAFSGVIGSRTAGLVWVDDDWRTTHTMRLQPPEPAASYPYVGSFNRSLFLSLGDIWLTGWSLTYPISVRNTSGVVRDSILAPAWFRNAPLEPGALAGPHRLVRRQDWFNSFDVIAGLFAVCDSLLAVVHGSLESAPDASRTHVRHTSATVLRQGSWDLVMELALPDDSQVVGATSDGFVILVATPPRPWTLVRTGC